MGSGGPKRSWRNRMACRTVAKASLVHRFAQALLKSSGEERGTEEEELPCPPSHSELTSHRIKLEMDVERLHEHLQREMVLHSALENAIAHAAGAFPIFPRNLPVDAQELLADVAMLEVAVSNLEEQMIGLKMQIRHERTELLHNAACYETSSPVLPIQRVMQENIVKKPRDFTDHVSSEGRMVQVDGPIQRCGNTTPKAFDLDNCSMSTFRLKEENVESNQGLKAEHMVHSAPAIRVLTQHRDPDAEIEPPHKDSKIGSERSKTSKHSEYDSRVIKKNDISQRAGEPLIDDKGQPCETRATSIPDEQIPEKFSSLESKTLWREPNRLSQEMVSCMIGIYCNLADPSEVTCKHKLSADNVSSPSSPFGHVTASSLSSLSNLSNLSFARSPSFERKNKEEQRTESNADPYRTCEKLPWGEIGSYRSAVEVSWMSVGKEQLEYAADALKIFRCLVEQLSKVDAISLGHHEKLAFWINIYNALMMHAYLAYGVPKNDVKYFALMQKAAYTVGGHFFNAVAIEHVLLRGKAPSYRPQIALLLALHKLKIPEGATQFAISRQEPLLLFALSSGAWSSPAVRIYTPENVQAQLQAALHDYVCASVSVSPQGTLLVPKLLFCYAREQALSALEVEDAHTLANWICGFLPAPQAAILRDCVGRIPAPAITVQPFDYRLRYLFL